MKDIPMTDAVKGIEYARHFSLDSALAFIKTMIRVKICDVYKNVVEFEYTEATNDSFVDYVPPNQAKRRGDMRGMVGIKSLVDNQDENGFVRDVDLARVIKSIAHETRHLEQMRKIYQDPDLSGYWLDMARMHMISRVFGSYKENTYAYLPSEIDADTWGFRHAVEYMDKNIVGPDGKPIINAKACLLRAIEEQPSWRGKRGCLTLDAAMEAVERRRLEYQRQDHRKDFYPMDGDGPVRSKAYKHWTPVLEKCEDAGVPQDEILFSAAMDVSPMFVSLTKGLIADARRVRKLYPGKCGAIEKLYRFVDPSYPVCDSGRAAPGIDVIRNPFDDGSGFSF